MLDNLEPVPKTTILISSDTLDQYRNTLVTLEVIDVDLKQVFDDILLPIGLTATFDGGTIRILKQREKTSIDLPITDFGSSWTKYYELAASSNDLINDPNNQPRKRNGWNYAGGRVYNLDASSKLTENKVLYRWNSGRAKMSIVTKYINGNETLSERVTEYIDVPVVERISKLRAEVDGLIPATHHPPGWPPGK